MVTHTILCGGFVSFVSHPHIIHGMSRPAQGGDTSFAVKGSTALSDCSYLIPGVEAPTWWNTRWAVGL